MKVREFEIFLLLIYDSFIGIGIFIRYFYSFYTIVLFCTLLDLDLIKNFNQFNNQLKEFNYLSFSYLFQNFLLSSNKQSLALLQILALVLDAILLTKFVKSPKFYIELFYNFELIFFKLDFVVIFFFEVYSICFIDLDLDIFLFQTFLFQTKL